MNLLHGVAKVIPRMKVGQGKVRFAPSTVAVTLAATFVGFVPLLAGPSYPSALLFGLVVPSITAVSTSLLGSPSLSPEEQLGLALKRAVTHALALSVPLCLHALRAGWCDPLHDLVLFALGPIFGLGMAAAWGTVTSIALRRFSNLAHFRALVVGLALVGPVGSMLAGLVTFYRSPIVFAFDPFVGFFAGSPYDTGFDPTWRLVSYRVGSAGTLVALWALLRHLHVTAPHRPQFRLPLDRACFLLGVLGLGLSIAITTQGVFLSHRSTEESIRRTLGQTLRFGRCEVVYGEQQKYVEVARLAKDCDAWLVRLERRLGTAKLDHVTAYVFDGPAQKELLMGAAHTQIAKPWRAEIYLNGANYPDDVVGHELAHIVAGQIAPGPFAVAGHLHGVIPNPGLIEGLAVALAPDEDGDLTPAQWAKTLQELGRLPPLRSLFSLSFFEHSSTMAYTVAGAFVDFVGQFYGKATVRAWYRGQSLEGITGATWVELEQRFGQYLTTLELPKNAISAAQARFARPGLFTRRCPHAVDRALATAEQKLRQGDAPTACQHYERALSLDPTEMMARFGLGECSRRSHDRTRAVEIYKALANDARLPQPTRERAEEQLADVWFESRKLEDARAIYQKLASVTLETDRRRSLEVKTSATSREAENAIYSLLIGENGEKTWDVAVRDLVLWSQAEPTNGIADYLLGRNFWSQGREPTAVEHLDRALSRSIAPPDVRAEALRLRAVVACARADVVTATELADRLSHETELPEPRRLGLLRLVERCAGRRVGDDWPETRELAKLQGALAPLVLGKPDGRASSPPTVLAWNSTEFTCPQGMAKVPGDTFWMGSKRGYNSDDETPRYQTKLRGFCLDLTEVTVASYTECVGGGACTKAQNESTTCNYGNPERGLHPINCVNYEQAEAYCANRMARLPSEVEWEFAARGGALAMKYPWGEGSPDGRACWKHHRTCPVKTFAAGAFGLFDMTGNVWEWTSSEYAPYPFPGRPEESHQKVYRGGGWSRRFEKWMHIGLRNRWGLHEHGAHLGFRCARTVEDLSCPEGTDAQGQCLPVVLAAECPALQIWNGHRCAAPNAPACDEGQHVDPLHGCVRDIPLVIRDHELDTKAVRRKRSPEFDADCRTNQPKRPQSYRYFGSEHEARNLVAKHAGCKNRDVGAGWNSTCCP